MIIFVYTIIKYSNLFYINIKFIQKQMYYMDIYFKNKTNEKTEIIINIIFYL